MNNPNGPYPGRQLFLGITEKGSPAFTYLVTGRSPASRERKATQMKHGIDIQVRRQRDTLQLSCGQRY